MKAQVMKRTAWLMGLSLIAVALSGCLEGDRAQEGNGDYRWGGSTKITSGADLLNGEGIELFSYPLGTSYQTISKSDFRLSEVYSKSIEVSSLDELEAALIVAPGEAPHLISLNESLVVDRVLKMSGHIAISGTQGLRFTPTGGLTVLNRSVTVVEQASLKSCTAGSLRHLITGSSLLIDKIEIDGPLNVLGNASNFHFIIAGESSRRSNLRLSFTGEMPVMLVVRPHRNLTVSGLNDKSRIVASDMNLYYDDEPLSRQLLGFLELFEPGSDTQIVRASSCQNLRAGISYDYNIYQEIAKSCRSGAWNVLASSFAYCGGVK